MTVTSPIREIKVALDFGDQPISVGRLAQREHNIYFEYDASFIDRGLEISPLRLPLSTGLKQFDNALFEGLPGVFNDSLPDGWGRLLFDRFMRSKGIMPSETSPLDRLAHVGTKGLGALTFLPDLGPEEANIEIGLDALAAHAKDVLNGSSEDVLKELIALNGSSAGARPKALIGMSPDRGRVTHGIYDLPADYTPWMVKFPNQQDGDDAGAIEYVYALMAKSAGIDMPEVHLFDAEKGSGYFAAQRFDYVDGIRHHMHTACGLLHSDFRVPALDYEDLTTLAGVLTRDVREVEKMYRLAVFNILSHNRDDHAKNFSFLMDYTGHWTLSPAYDLTFSSGPRGEQSTTTMGEGRTPDVEHLLALAKAANISKPLATDIIDATRESINQWPDLAKNYGVRGVNVKQIWKRLK